MLPIPRRVFYLGVLALCLAVGLGAVILRRIVAGMPGYWTLEEYKPSLTTLVFDSRDKQVAELSIEKRALLTLSQIPVDLQNAVLATEDVEFFRHWGISPKGMMRAFLRNLIHGRVLQGGSTLTQQLSKLIFLSPERKITRKLKEILLALELERNFSKEEILQLYLNQIYFGHGAYGVQAAARVYFGKEINDLTLAECAMLAGLIKYPGGYSPFTHAQAAMNRRKLVLNRMLDENFIKAEEAKKAAAEPLPTIRPLQAGIEAPYFVEHVRRHLEPKYGYHTFWRGGLKIYTTLDVSWQKTAETVMEKALTEFDGKALKEWERKKKEEEDQGIEPPTISTSPPPPIQGAFVIIDVKSGAIRTLIGGRGESQYNRATQALRQPGSTFKPFVWGAALDSGMTGASLVEDSPLAYYSDGRDWRLLEGATDQYAIELATTPFAASPDFKVWVPNNFDSKFLGVITLRKALALSRNIASVRLIEHVGPPKVVELAHSAGIHADLAPVLALGLGSSVVAPLEMASAFATFANGGIHVEPYDVTRVEDSSGRVIERHIPSEKEAMSPQLAYLITNLMKSVVERGTAVHAKKLKRPLAGKTGTTNDNRDLWFIGFTPDVVAAAWMGYDNDMSLGRKDWTGGSTVVPWWVEIMEQILKEYPPRDFPVPDRIVFQKVCGETGLLALPTCPKAQLESFQKGTEPMEYCSVDHSRPLALQPSFGAPNAGTAVQVGTTDQVPVDPNAPPPLPSDEELQNTPVEEGPAENNEDVNIIH
ncbi:MAG: transglycosylase domain-containing protein [Elusimicrobia bacterium]|nr:transglycosylase domain-containing protein [Elusimicrobiota bacterium]